MFKRFRTDRLGKHLLGRALLALLFASFHFHEVQAQVDPALDSAGSWLLSQQNLNGGLGAIPDLLPRESAPPVLAPVGRGSAETAATRGAFYLAEYLQSRWRMDFATGCQNVHGETTGRLQKNGLAVGTGRSAS